MTISSSQLLALLVLVAPLPMLADATYTAQLESNRGRSIERVSVSGSRARVEALEDPTVAPGFLMMTTDSGKTVYVIEPKASSCVRASQELVRQAQTTGAGPSGIELLKTERLDDQPGPAIAGVETRFYRIKMVFRDPALKGTITVQEEYWVVPASKDLGARILSDPEHTGIPELDDPVEREVGKIPGLPLKMIETTKGEYANGEVHQTRRSMEVTEFDSSRVQESVFQLPPQCAEPSVPSVEDVRSKQAAPQESVTERVNKLADLQKQFARKTLNSPGVELFLKEEERAKSPTRTLVTYGLYASGLPLDRTYTMIQIQLDGSLITAKEGVSLGANGRVICAGRSGTCHGAQPNDPIDIVVYAGRGEPKRFGLISEDSDKLRGFTYVVPFPIVAENKGCRLQAILGSPNGELMFLDGAGFAPNADLTMESRSYDETHGGPAKADSGGTYFSAMLPYVAGKDTGKTRVRINSSSCSPEITFTWGKDTYHLE